MKQLTNNQDQNCMEQDLRAMKPQETEEAL